MKIVSLITIGLSLLLTACVSNAGTYSNPETPLVVQKGDRFTIELASNVTTGYGWEFGSPLDTKYLKVVKTYYDEPKNGLIGSGGTQGWIFETLQPGSTSITLEYKRPWELTEPPDHTIIFTVEIK